MRYIKKFLVGAAASAAFLFIVARVPEYHDGYLIDKVGLKTFRVVDPLEHGRGGTGFSVVAPSGKTYTLTNGHVCGLASNETLHALVPGTDRAYTLRVLEVSKDTDLCLLEPVPNYAGVALANSAAIGELFDVVGHPLLMPLSISKGTLTAYETITLVVSVNGNADNCIGPGYTWSDASGTSLTSYGIFSVCKRTVEAVYTTAVIYPGNSGSPAVNFWGNVVGVVFAGDNRSNYGYLIPLRDVYKFLSIY